MVTEEERQEEEKVERLLKQLKEIDLKREAELASGKKQTEEDIKRKELIAFLQKKREMIANA